jgi:hypothetical protein
MPRHKFAFSEFFCFKTTITMSVNNEPEDAFFPLLEDDDDEDSMSLDMRTPRATNNEDAITGDCVTINQGRVTPVGVTASTVYSIKVKIVAFIALRFVNHGERQRELLVSKI